MLGPRRTRRRSNAERRGQLVEVAIAAEAVGQEYAKVRTRLLAIPASHAPQLARITTPAAMQAALRKLIEAALIDLTADETVCADA